MVCGMDPVNVAFRGFASIQLASLGAPIGPVLAGAVIGAVGVVHAVVVYGCAYVALGGVAVTAPALRGDPGR